MTWHAARFLLLNAALLVISACAFFLLAATAHNGHRWLRLGLGRFRHHPLFGAFIRRHFISHRSSAVRAALVTAVVAFSAYAFVHILRGVLTDSNLVRADIRLHNTLRMFRSEALHERYSEITRLASGWFVGPVVAAIVALLYAARRRRDALMLAAGFALQALLAVALEYVVSRPRPPEAQPFVSGPSFPSGHTLTAAVVYGFLAYLLVTEGSKRRWGVVAALPLFALIVLVPLSRVYLGVHWPYDTIASLALGIALVGVLTETMKLRAIARLQGETPRWFGRAALVVAVLVVAGGAVYARARLEHEVRPAMPPLRGIVSMDLVRRQFPERVSRHSEDLIGGPMEPAAFVFAGDAAQIERGFEGAGWSLAETPSATGLLHELYCVVRNLPDPHGPATPAYYDTQPQDLTFERPGAGSGSIRHRHHIRIWRAPVNVAGSTPLWTATCSYDAGVKFVAKPYLITHRIDPHIDVEREMIAAQLSAAGAKDLGFVTVTGPTRGRNAGGDAFETDGRAHVISFMTTAVR